MTWWEITVAIVLGLACGGTFLVGAWIVCTLVAIWWQHRHDPYPGEAAGDDDTMAVADAVAEHQRAEPWTGGPIGVAYTGSGRLSDGWIAYAEAEADWHALEYLATGKRTEVTR